MQIRCVCPVPDGRWHLFAASFPNTIDPTGYLLPDMHVLEVAEGAEPIHVVAGSCDTNCVLTLRRVRPTDPPILVALTPFLPRGNRSAVGRAPRRAATRHAPALPSVS